MILKQLVAHASDKTNFLTLENFLDFATRYVEFISNKDNLQAVIVSRNERQYQFLQYKEDGHFNVTRALNANLIYDASFYATSVAKLLELLNNIRDGSLKTPENRELLNRAIYTTQQAIGATLDALPVGLSNTARKINGDLFERLIRLVITHIGVSCEAGIVSVPIEVEGEQAFFMNYQHDLIIKSGVLVKAIGSVKTSSKDRIDKIFIDKFLFNRLTGKDVPHIAIFLNDVQRTGSLPKFGIGATFLPGHFKGYTLKLNALDGVYYCDIRPNMVTDPLLKRHIRTFDCLLFDDLWELLQRDAVIARVETKEE